MPWRTGADSSVAAGASDGVSAARERLRDARGDDARPQPVARRRGVETVGRVLLGLDDRRRRQVEHARIGGGDALLHVVERARMAADERADGLRQPDEGVDLGRARETDDTAGGEVLGEPGDQLADGSREGPAADQLQRIVGADEQQDRVPLALHLRQVALQHLGRGRALETDDAPLDRPLLASGEAGGGLQHEAVLEPLCADARGGGVADREQAQRGGAAALGRGDRAVPLALRLRQPDEALLQLLGLPQQHRRQGEGGGLREAVDGALGDLGRIRGDAAETCCDLHADHRARRIRAVI
jgi:hypothetical protein